MKCRLGRVGEKGLFRLERHVITKPLALFLPTPRTVLDLHLKDVTHTLTYSGSFGASVVGRIKLYQRGTGEEGNVGLRSCSCGDPVGWLERR
jgi:hypothetical protein